MEDYNKYIEYKGEIPQLKDTRISVLDVVIITETPYQDENKIFDYWDLSEEQVDAAMKYFQNNKNEIIYLQNKIKNKYYH